MEHINAKYAAVTQDGRAAYLNAALLGPAFHQVILEEQHSRLPPDPVFPNCSRHVFQVSY